MTPEQLVFWTWIKIESCSNG